MIIINMIFKHMIFKHNKKYFFQKNKLFDLMDPTSPMYTRAVLTMVGMLISLTLGGLVFDYGYLRPKQREILAANSKLKMIVCTSISS